MRLDHDLSASAQRHPDKIALVCGAQRATYAQVERGANALAHALLALGLQRQERVAICLENSIEVVQGLYATLKAAGVFVVINPQVKGDKLAFILRDCQVRVLLTDAAHLRELRNELATCTQLAHVVVVDVHEQEATALPVHAWSELLSAYAAVDGAPPAALALSIDLASLIYTSGSTGLPKGVMLTHANMHAAVRAITTYLRNAPDDIILSPLPLAFDYGLYQVLMAFYFGGTVVLEKQFLYPYQYIDRLVQERATGLPMVPAISAILLNLKDLETHDFSSVRYVTNTAQAWPEHHIRRLRKIMPQARLYSMYGLTECKRVAYLPPELIDTKPTSVGVAIPGTEVWLENESGQVLSTPGEVGELMVRGPHVMPGYWNRPEETAQRLRPGRHPDERVLMTGDLFRQDEAGHLYFVSRKDDLIKTGGERVGPREVENVLYELEAVNEAAVIGVPDEVLGSAIKAFIALRAGMTLSAAEVIRHCRLRLEAFRVPKHVEFVPELPKTSTGKISKQSLR